MPRKVDALSAESTNAGHIAALHDALPMWRILGTGAFFHPQSRRRASAFFGHCGGARVRTGAFVQQ
jgi:hypothetical protein